MTTPAYAQIPAALLTYVQTGVLDRTAYLVWVCLRHFAPDQQPGTFSPAPITLTDREIAEWLGLSRSRVQQSLRGLEREQLLQRVSLEDFPHQREVHLRLPQEFSPAVPASHIVTGCTPDIVTDSHIVTSCTPEAATGCASPAAWDRLWDQVLQLLETQLSVPLFMKHLQHTQCLGLEGHTLRVQVRDAATGDWLQQQLCATILQVVRESWCIPDIALPTDLKLKFESTEVYT